MDRQYCFGGTFQRIIGLLDTIRGFAIGFLSEKSDADVCSITVTLTYRQHRAYDHSATLVDSGFLPPST
jgi:hypothetical protein